jgi:hypothetical protein
LLDGSLDTKWLDFGAGGGSQKSWFAVALHAPAALEFYGLSSANDEVGRDPCTWSLFALPVGDAEDWVTLDRRVDVAFPSRKSTLTYWVRHASRWRAVVCAQRAAVGCRSYQPLKGACSARSDWWCACSLALRRETRARQPLTGTCRDRSRASVTATRTRCSFRGCSSSLRPHPLLPRQVRLSRGCRCRCGWSTAGRRGTGCRCVGCQLRRRPGC